MSSLRRRLTLGVGLVVFACLAAFSLVLYLGERAALHRQLDEGLLTSAEAIASMAEDPAPEPWEVEYAGVSDFETNVRPGYFEVWIDPQTVLARSGSLRGGNLAYQSPAGQPRYFTLQLPDGRTGRGVVVERRARTEDPRVLGRPVVAQIARGTEEVDGALARMALILAGLTLLGSLLGSGAGALIVARGLKPVAALSEQLAQVKVGDLGRKLEVSGLPAELKPLVEKLNDALERLGESFQRERRFTADVSHELRTPLAALRLTLEVSASAPRDPASYHAAIEQAVASVAQLQALVDNLLLLARLDAGQLPLSPESVALRELGETAWRPFGPVAERRRLRFVNRLSGEARVHTDPAKLKVILDTLLSNAASHTAEGGEVVLDGGTEERWLEVWDSGPEVEAALLPKVFERFVRGDQARTGSEHTGIGLSLAQAMAAALALQVSVENRGGGVRFWVHPRPPRA